MTRLALISTIVGGAIIASRLPGVIAPARFREFMVKFPRSEFWGRVLITIVTPFAWRAMYQWAHNDPELKWLEPVIIVGVPVALYLIYRYGVHYLALRASAALLLLIAKQMVDAADASDTVLRLVVTVLAYVWVVAAIWMTVAPHHFRDLIGWAMAKDERCRTACSLGICVGVMLMALGLLVY